MKQSKIFFTCGPSQLYPTIPKHLLQALKDDIPSISHRSPQFETIYQSTVNNLKKLLDISEDFHIFFLPSSLESMERIIQNCVEMYSFHFVNGAFSRKFYQIAVGLKKKPVRVEVAEGKGFNFETIRIPENNELICITHNETSTGIAQPLHYNIIMEWRRRGILVAVDMVSSAPYVKLDFSKIDAAFFSVQKGFGLPAGLGILIVNDRALDKARWLERRGVNVGAYHSFTSLVEKEKKHQTPETPNVLNIYLLGKVIEDMLQSKCHSREGGNLYGIDAIRFETDQKAKLLYDFFANHKKYKPFVRDIQFRSKTTIVIDVRGETKKIQQRLGEKGIVVSSGYGKFKEEHIRIANFPAHPVQDIKKMLKYIGSI